MIAVRRDLDSLGPAGRASTGSGPTAARMVLGTQLRRLREAKQISRQAAGYAIRASASKISRLELGRVAFKQRDITDLLTLYGVTDPREREAYLTLAQEANSPGWWHKFSDVLSGWFEMYVGLEQVAAVIRSYEVQFVPGLFQTEQYARAVTLLGHPGASATEVDHRVDLRIARQKLLTTADPPNVWAVVDEAALHRVAGGQQIMRAQLERLIELIELPNVTVQIMPFQAGGHAAAGGSFTILRFAEPDIPDIVYLEQLTSALYLDKASDVDEYFIVMDRLCVEAHSPEVSTKLLQSIVKDL